MDILDKYKHLSVKIKCLDFNGSGCIFQPFSTEYTYVLTAKHCLKGSGERIQEYQESDILIKNYVNGIENQLEVIKVYEHPTLDFAIIKVNYFELPFKTFISNPRLNYPLGLYGFPGIFKTQSLDDARQRLICELVDKKEVYIEFKPHKTDSYTHEAASNIKGFSGSGLYLEHENELFLTGIFTELKDSYATFDILKAVKISEVNKMLVEKKLPGLLPKDLASFKEHIELAFEVLDGKSKSYLKRVASSLSEISPKDLADKINKRLFLPYNDRYELEVYESKIWEGWIALLTYLYINLGDSKIDIFLNKVMQEYPLENIRLFYTEKTTLQRCIMALCDIDTYDELKSGDLVIINNKRTPPIKHMSTEKIRTNILQSIDGNLLFEKKGYDITDPNYYKDIRCIHLELFMEEFAKHEDLENFSEAEEAVIRSVKEVFENA